MIRTAIILAGVVAVASVAQPASCSTVEASLALLESGADPAVVAEIAGCPDATELERWLFPEPGAAGDLFFVIEGGAEASEPGLEQRLHTPLAAERRGLRSSSLWVGQFLPPTMLPLAALVLDAPRAGDRGWFGFGRDRESWPPDPWDWSLARRSVQRSRALPPVLPDRSTLAPPRRERIAPREPGEPMQRRVPVRAR